MSRQPGSFHPRPAPWARNIPQRFHISREWHGQEPWSNNDLLFCATEHISHWASTIPILLFPMSFALFTWIQIEHNTFAILQEDNVRACGAMRKVVKLYNSFRSRKLQFIMETIDEAGFSPLYAALQALMDPTGHCVARALSERYWDTTNTFHIAGCEMTITPYDFAMITGLPFHGEHLQYDDTLEQDKLWQVTLFGPIMNTITTPRGFRYDIFFDLVSTEEFWGPNYIPAQRKRIILALLICTTIFAERGGRAYFHYLGNLADLTHVQNLNWGEAAYSCLIQGLRSGVRAIKAGKDKKRNIYLKGLWKVIEVWFYEYLGIMSPGTNAEKVFPAALRWSNEAIAAKRPAVGDLPALRSILNQAGRGLSNPWKEFEMTEDLLPGLYKLQALNDRRILFEGPFGFAWYCGERVTWQTLERWPPFVPVDPPEKMFYVRCLTSNELQTAREGITFDQLTVDDTNYIPTFCRRLMGRMHTGRPEFPDITCAIMRSEEQCPGLPLPATSPGFDREDTIKAVILIYSLKDQIIRLQKRLLRQRRRTSRQGGRGRLRGRRKGCRGSRGPFRSSRRHDCSDHEDDDDDDDTDLGCRGTRGEFAAGSSGVGSSDVPHASGSTPNIPIILEDEYDDDDDNNNDNNDLDWHGTRGKFAAGSSGVRSCDGDIQASGVGMSSLSPNIPIIPEDVAMDILSSSSEGSPFRVSRNSRRHQDHQRYTSDNSSSEPSAHSSSDSEDYSIQGYYEDPEMDSPMEEDFSIQPHETSQEFKDVFDAPILATPAYNTISFFASSSSYSMCKDEPYEEKYNDTWALATGVNARVLQGRGKNVYYVDEHGQVYPDDSPRASFAVESDHSESRPDLGRPSGTQENWHYFSEEPNDQPAYKFPDSAIIDLVSDDED